MDKFLGVGLKAALGLFIFMILMIVFTKVIFNKYPVPGVTDIVNVV